MAIGHTEPVEFSLVRGAPPGNGALPARSVRATIAWMTSIVAMMAIVAARRGSGRRMPAIAAAAVRLERAGRWPVAVARGPVHVI